MAASLVNAWKDTPERSAREKSTIANPILVKMAELVEISSPSSVANARMESGGNTAR